MAQGAAGLPRAEQTPTDSPSSPAALDRNQQQYPCYFLLLSFLHKASSSFSFKRIFLKTQTAKKSTCEFREKKQQLPQSTPAPGQFEINERLVQFPLARNSVEKQIFLSPKSAVSFQCTTAKTTDMKSTKMWLTRHLIWRYKYVFLIWNDSNAITVDDVMIIKKNYIRGVRRKSMPAESQSSRGEVKKQDGVFTDEPQLQRENKILSCLEPFCSY